MYHIVKTIKNSDNCAIVIYFFSETQGTRSRSFIVLPIDTKKEGKKERKLAERLIFCYEEPLYVMTFICSLCMKNQCNCSKIFHLTKIMKGNSSNAIIT